MRTLVRYSPAASDGTVGCGIIAGGDSRRGSHVRKLAAILATSCCPLMYLMSQRPASAAPPFAPERVRKIGACRPSLARARPDVA